MIMVAELTPVAPLIIMAMTYLPDVGRTLCPLLSQGSLKDLHFATI